MFENRRSRARREIGDCFQLLSSFFIALYFCILESSGFVQKLVLARPCVLFWLVLLHVIGYLMELDTEANTLHYSLAAFFVPDVFYLFL